jgi:hypothetical protein
MDADVVEVVEVDRVVAVDAGVSIAAAMWSGSMLFSSSFRPPKTRRHAETYGDGSAAWPQRRVRRCRSVTRKPGICGSQGPGAWSAS